MNLEPIYNNLQTSVRKDIGTTQIVVPASIQIDKDGGIETILSVCATPLVQSVVNSQGESKFAGNTAFNVVYQTSNGDIDNASAMVDFSGVFQSEDIKDESRVITSARLIDLQVEEVGETIITMSANVEISCCGVFIVDNKYLSAVTGEVFVKNDKICTTKLKQCVMSNYLSAHEIEIPKTPAKILCSQSAVVQNDIICGNGYVAVNGIIQYNICYLYQDEEETKFANEVNSYAFKYEIDAPDVTSEDKAYVRANVKLDGVNVTFSEKDDKSQLTIETSIEFSGEVYEDNNTEIVSDLFSCKNKIDVTYSSVDYSQVYKKEFFTDNISGIVTLDDEMPRIDKILCDTNTNVLITKTYVSDNSFNIEGIACSTIIYRNEDEKIESNMSLEVPFVTSYPIDTCMLKTLEFNSTSIICDLQTRVRRGREIEIECVLKTFVMFFTDNTSVVLSYAEAQTEEKIKPNALTIYIARAGDTPWSISKKMNIDPKVLVLQNPSIETEIKQGQKLVVYRKR